MTNKPKNMKITVIEESLDGLYVWETEGGKIVADSEGNIMNIESRKGDQAKIDALKSEAERLLGEPGGRAVFWSGRRRISDEQYEEQKARQAAGLTPDPFDVGAMEDDLKEAIHDGGNIR